MRPEHEIAIVSGTAEGEALRRALPGALALAPGEADAAGLAARGVRVLVDAAHPGDTALHWALRRAADEAGADHLQLRRRGFGRRPGDAWVRVPDAGAAARVIPAGARVFVTTGRQDMAALRPLRAHLFLRRRDGRPGRCPLPQGRYVAGQGPFTLADEVALFRRLKIDWLITRDAGGAGSRPKIDAARRLGIRVALISRGAAPPGPRATTPEEALTWLTRAGS